MQNTPSKLLAASTLLAGFVGFSSIAQAQVSRYSGTGSWSDVGNPGWDVAPTASVEIGEAGTTDVVTHSSTTANSTLTGTLTIGVGTGSSGTLNLSGGTLTSAGSNLSGSDNATGTFNINGGRYETSGANNLGAFGSGSAKLNLSSGTLTTTSGNQAFFQLGGNSEFNISGGSVEYNGGGNGVRVQTGFLGGGTSNFTITGSDASLDFGNFTMNGTGNLNFNFNADADGVSVLNSNSFDNIDGSALNESIYVDVANYDVNTNGTTITLIDTEFSSWDQDDFANLQVLNGTGNFVFTADGFGTVLTLENITVVPEPSSFALLGGFLALGSVMLRRRR